MDNFERTDAGNLTDEGIRQYLLAKFNRVTKIKDKRIKELERRLLEHLKGHSLEAICDECSSHYWYVDDEPIVCPRCHPEQTLRG